ncbi:hypothetical protein [Nonomuraea sp. NPDC050310]|uniref:hypothetical protein n=1 Tax=Nonomuraea sp. NPDC050310 TaxID=3154935 RepID=UPI0033F81B21
MPEAVDEKLLHGILREGYLQVIKAWKEATVRAEQAETQVENLHWLIGAGVQVTIGMADHQGMAQIGVSLDITDKVSWHGDLDGCLAEARAYCEFVGVTP